MTLLPRALVRDVWTHLRARDTRPRPQLPEGRGQLRVVALDGGQSTDVYLYDEIGSWGITAADVVGELLTIGTPRITMRINSPGGDAFDSIAIYNALMEHPARVEAQVDGLAASGASLVAMAAESRSMKTGTQMMIHDAHGIVAGNEADMRSYADLLGRICEEMAGLYAARAGGTAESWRAVMKAETWYTAAEAREAGLATDTAPAAAEEGDGPHLVPAAKFDLNLTSFLYAGRAAAPPPPRRDPEPGPVVPTPPPVSRSGWADLDFSKMAAAFAAVRNPHNKEAAR